MANNVQDLRPKTADTEKITINLGFVDLGQVDLLVQEGFYSNRTDFIRTAIRNQIERHVDVVRKAGLNGKMALSSFDISPALLDAIKKGDAVAGIDQLMYMQGYLPAVLTRAYLDYGMMPATDVSTGPAVIDAGNIDKVQHRVMDAGIE